MTIEKFLKFTFYFIAVILIVSNIALCGIVAIELCEYSSIGYNTIVWYTAFSTMFYFFVMFKRNG